MQKTEVIKFLNKYKNLSKAEEDIIVQQTDIAEYSAKDYFLESGKRSNEIGFIKSGIFRYYFFNSKGEEITAHFMKENEFVGNVTSFFEYSLSAGSIEAITDCEIIRFSRNNWKTCQEKVEGWDTIIQMIINETLVKKTNFQRSLINESATDSYLKFLNYYPQIAQRVPLQYIASYLGITPFSLSRIRKSISSL